MSEPHIISPTDLILVTGSGGFIGARVVDRLLKAGFTRLRCFVRASSDLSRLKEVIAGNNSTESVEIVSGDLLSREDCNRAAADASVIYHLAAGVEKSFAGAFMNSALATRNLMDAALKSGKLKRFVNVSSFAVYSNLAMDRHALLDENCPLEDNAQARFDAYCFGKLKQDELVIQYGKEQKLPYVIVRPGSVYGPGKPSITGRVGIDTFGFFIHLGGSNQLPLVFVDNCAEAIVLAGLRPGVDGEIFNIVDDQTLTSRELLREIKKRKKMRFSISLPYAVTRTLCNLWENYSLSSKGQLPPVFNRRRCSAEWKGNRFTNAKLRNRLGWSPRVEFRDAIDQYLAQFE